MPRSAARPCKAPRCAGLVYGADRRYCDRHAADELEERQRSRARVDERRGTAASRGYGERWRKARAAFLAAHPLCADPDRLHPDQVRAARVVDHVVPHRGDDGLFWDSSNWQPLCFECHAAKTARGE